MSLFQFTPLREGRPGRYDDSSAAGHGNFNSRPCVRGDPRRAPASSPPCSYFNSRPCVRGDRISNPFIIFTIRFQFTPLREGRRVNTNS